MQKTQNKKNKTNVALLVSTIALGVLSATFITLYAISASAMSAQTTTLDNVYSKNFYELVDNINNTENKLAKAINSTTNSKLQAKYLYEVSQNTKLASTNLNNLPYSSNGLEKSLAFVNQVGGYSETLVKNLENGENLSNKDMQTLENIYDSVLYMKQALVQLNQDMWNGYSISKASQKFDGEFNEFTKSLAKIKPVDVEYPTMIYDGPFSDSVVNKKVEGLPENVVDENTAKQNLLKIFTSIQEDSVMYKSASTGKFETYNFACLNQDGNETMYIQMTKQGGRLLTATAFTDRKAENITLDNAKEIALNFANRANIENAKVVWSDEIGGNAYINLAPVQNGYILYPDLVKVKIDLSNGDVLGYEATNYFTNHISSRSFANPTMTKDEIKANVPKKYVVNFVRLALIPLDYNQEIYTYEVACTMGGDDYYFYYDVQTGEEVNILKVIKTNNGNLLM